MKTFEQLFGEMQGFQLIGNNESISITKQRIFEVAEAFEAQFKEQPKLSIEERKANFATAIYEFKNDYPRETLKEFYSYWTEHSPKGKQMRFEKQPVFDIKKRLIRWTKNNKNGQTKTNRNELEDLNQSAIQHLKS